MRRSGWVAAAAGAGIIAATTAGIVTVAVGTRVAKAAAREEITRRRRADLIDAALRRD